MGQRLIETPLCAFRDLQQEIGRVTPASREGGVRVLAEDGDKQMLGGGRVTPADREGGVRMETEGGDKQELTGGTHVTPASREGGVRA